jgi:glycosyltransferase involved in cell wall biosynthesis
MPVITESKQMTKAKDSSSSVGTKPTKGRYVCMIAYTIYDFDGRVRREAETLASSGFHVRCLTPMRGSRPEPYAVRGVRVHELHAFKYQGKSKPVYFASYLWFLLASSLACLKLLFKGELDVVHAHNLPDFLVFAGLVPRVFGRKIVLDVHDSVPETFATKFSPASTLWKAMCFEEKVSALLAHKVICVNHPQRDVLVSRGIPSSKTFISMNMPDPTIFDLASLPARSIDDSSFNLVYHGTMSVRLGVDLVIRAVALSRRQIPNVRLHLWGGGDDLKLFRALVHELQLENTVLFDSGFALQDLPPRLNAMHVGIVGNRHSLAGDLMLPVKLLEYVSMDIPAIVPRLKAIEHYFSDDMVLYYAPGDVEACAAAIYRLYCRPELRCGQAQRARQVLTDHGWERQGPELVALYRALLEH